MFRLNAFLMVVGLAVCGQSLAMVNCNGESTVVCMKLTGSTQGHYLSTKIGHITSRATCVSSTSVDSAGGISNEDMDDALAYHFFKLGNNTIQFKQCNNKTCSHSKMIGEYTFNLSKSAHGDYQATPDQYNLTITDYGDTCTVDPNYAKFSHF